MIDLHTHTNYSDGTWNLSRLLKEAEIGKIDILSITDHDTIDAYKELEKINYREIYSGKIISGVEFTTVYDGVSFHMLAYDFDYKKLDNWIKENYENNKLEEIIHLIEEINKKNYNLNIKGTDETMISKLKNEMYKTVVMLKNDADNSLKDKLIIKTYLEDISHQLKTPLTVINISLDNLIDNPNMDEKNRNEFISKISKEVTNINNLIQNLLKLSKFDVNVINFVNKSVNIKEFINKSIDKISLIADLKNINIKVNILNDFNLNIDLNWQIEALSNIVKNAIEHSNENDMVYINCNDNKIYSKIEIINNGIINDKDLNKIFDRFYTNKKGYSESVGIGLSLAKNIIEKNNGKIDVYSKDGKTIFTIKYYK